MTFVFKYNEKMNKIEMKEIQKLWTIIVKRFDEK